MKEFTAERSPRMRQIIAALVLVIGIAAVIWVYPNLFSGKEESQSFLLTAQTDAADTQLSNFMAQANTAMFSRLTALGLVDFTIEQTSSNQISVSLTPEGNNPQQALAVESAVDLLCRPGVVQFLAADQTVILDNSLIDNAKLTANTENDGFQITVHLKLLGSEAMQKIKDQALSGKLFPSQTGLDASTISVVLDGRTAASFSLTEVDKTDEITLSLLKDESAARELTALLNSPSLPCSFQRTADGDSN